MEFMAASLATTHNFHGVGPIKLLRTIVVPLQVAGTVTPAVVVRVYGLALALALA